MQTLKDAEALFTLLPASIYTPYLLFVLRASGRANSGPKLTRLIFATAASFPGIEVSSRYLRDQYYWPLVQGVYRDIKLGSGGDLGEKEVDEVD